MSTFGTSVKCSHRFIGRSRLKLEEISFSICATFFSALFLHWICIFPSFLATHNISHFFQSWKLLYSEGILFVDFHIINFINDSKKKIIIRKLSWFEKKIIGYLEVKLYLRNKEFYLKFFQNNSFTSRLNFKQNPFSSNIICFYTTDCVGFCLKFNREKKTSCDVEIHCDARDIENQYSDVHLPPQVKGRVANPAEKISWCVIFQLGTPKNVSGSGEFQWSTQNHRNLWLFSLFSGHWKTTEIASGQRWNHYFFHWKPLNSH